MTINKRDVLTKADIVNEVQSRLGLPRKKTAEVVDDLFNTIKDILETGESVKISGFGNFEVRDKKERPGRNPKSGEFVMIPARRVMTFKPSLKLRKALREPNGSQGNEE